MAYNKEEFELIQLDEILEPFKLSNETLVELKKKIDHEIRKGLNRNTHGSSDLKCYPTWLQDLPTGCEHGMFLAVSLYNTRCCLVFTHLRGENNCQIESQEFDIPLRLHEATELFEFLVNKLVLFVKKLQLQREPLPVALVISEPLYHADLTSAILLKYSKIARIRGLEKKNIGQLMKEALKRTTGAYLDLVAVLNDATGIFVSTAWHNPHCKISGIIDEGINIAYLEQINNIEIIDQPTSNVHMLVNTEVGNFGNHGQLEFIQTPFDTEPNDEDEEFGKYVFEKMITGNNIGEIIRNVIVKAVEENLLFDGILTKGLQTKNSIKLEQVLIILSEKDEFYQTPLIFDKLGVTSPSKFDFNKVVTIAEAVAMRAAHLYAAALAAIVDRLDVKETELPIIIGMDGKCFCSIPMYPKWIEDKLKELIATEHTVKLVNSMDVHGRGAAILSAVAIRKNYIYEQLDNITNKEEELKTN